MKNFITTAILEKISPAGSFTSCYNVIHTAVAEHYDLSQLGTAGTKLGSLCHGLTPRRDWRSAVHELSQRDAGTGLEALHFPAIKSTFAMEFEK